jgi:hypothetical protein
MYSAYLHGVLFSETLPLSVPLRFIIEKIIVSLKQDGSLWNSLCRVVNIVPRSRVHRSLILISLHAVMLQVIGTWVALPLLVLYLMIYFNWT